MEFRLELIKFSPSGKLLDEIHNADSLLVINDCGCIKTDNFMVDSYSFDSVEGSEVELILTERPLFAKNKEQLLLDII